MSEDDAFRANLGMLNGSAEPTTVRYALYDADGVMLARAARTCGLREHPAQRVFQAFSPVSGYVDV